MSILAKDEPATWWNGSKSRYAPANLDQVVATTNLEFKTVWRYKRAHTGFRLAERTHSKLKKINGSSVIPIMEYYILKF